MLKFLFNYVVVTVICAVCASGCTALGLNKQKKESIDYSNGVNGREAVLMAKEQLLASEYTKDYRLKSSEILRNVFVKRYPDYWFISHEANDFDRAFWSYLVVIQKETGEVVFADPYIPLKVVDYDWVFEGAGNTF